MAFALLAGSSAFACEGKNMSSLAEGVEEISQVDVGSFQKTVPIAVNKDTFFCKDDSFVFIVPNINDYAQLTQPTTLVAPDQSCAGYDKAYFDGIYERIARQGGVLFNSLLYVKVELVTKADGSKTCRKVLSEMVDLVPEAACMVNEKKIVLETLPLSACGK